MTGVTVVYAREPIPVEGPSVFLAGPTPRAGTVPSWRPAAITVLERAWTGQEPLTVLTPESRGGRRAAEYHDQVEWETAGLDRATAILFWIPRDLHTLPGFTTNVEFGLYARSGRVVLGVPPECPNPERNRYPVWVAQRYGVPVLHTLTAAVSAVLAVATADQIEAPPAATSMSRAAEKLRSPYLCNWHTEVALALADWLDDADRESAEVGPNPKAVATAQALLTAFGVE